MDLPNKIKVIYAKHYVPIFKMGLIMTYRDGQRSDYTRFIPNFRIGTCTLRVFFR